MGRLHNGFDVYLGSPDAPFTEHSLTFTATVILEDIQAKVLQVKTRDDRNNWAVVYRLTGISKMQVNGTAIRWTGTAEDGSTIMLSGVSVKGGCVPCSRR